MDMKPTAAARSSLLTSASASRISFWISCRSFIAFLAFLLASDDVDDGEQPTPGRESGPESVEI